MGRAPCCDKTNVKRGPWSPEEDETLKNYLRNNGTGGNWISLPQRAGLRRCGKSCRLRWLNYLRPDIKHGDFSEAEDNTIISMYYKMGSRWSIIASNLPGRTDNDVKNHWNTKLKKKLFAETSNNNNKKLNPTIKTHFTFTNNNVVNPIFQLPTSSSTPTLPSPSLSITSNLNSYDHITNHVHNNQDIYVPNPSFSDLFAHCTTNTFSMSLLPNFTTLAYDDGDHGIAHDPVGIPNPTTRYPFLQGQASSSAENVIVCPHEEVSSASGSSSAVYGSGFEDDPFLAELGFGLMQEEVMMNNPACNVDVDQEDIKPEGLGQGLAN
ncbi:uncharacterized protein LOC141612152 [Silene latifolia]|uniref:uncharacterized protein LOC141612152 n=1 Tax=Silene latifolia TaxID=37657 RepID=UPI003D76BE96